MASAREALGTKGSNETTLKGSDLPQKMREVEVHIRECREAPKEFNSPLICDIVQIFGKTSFPLNKTNTRFLIEKLGDDYDQWAGHVLTLEKTLTRNPRTNQQAYGLAIVEVSAKPRKLPPIESDTDAVA